MCCKKYFYDKFIEIINQWKEDEIAAISILVYSNETYVYKGIKNFFEISIGYIQKDDKYDSDDVKGLKVNVFGVTSMAVPCLFYFRYFSRIISLISALLYPCRANNLISSKYSSNDSAFSTNMRLVCAKISKNSK